jgi:hypothetical protein
MEKENNLVIIDASMIYIIGSELEHLQLEPLGIMKLDEFISDILITTGSKDYLGFIGGEEISEKISLLLSPTKDQARKTRVVRILAAYIGPKNDRTLGISTL